MKIINVRSCDKCPFKICDDSNDKWMCKHGWIDIPDVSIISDFCPLEDKYKNHILSKDDPDYIGID